MSGLDKHMQKQKRDKTIYTNERTKRLVAAPEQKITAEELYDKIDTRINETSTFKDRSEYYFRDSEMTRAKAKRYKNISNSGDDIRNYSRVYKNHGTTKRKKYAKEAAASFEKAAAIEDTISNRTKGFELYKLREKALRFRMEGRVKAAMLKSQSKSDETFRMLKARYSSLSILMDQLNHLKEGVTDQAELNSFETEKAKLELELTKVKDEFQKSAPTAQKKWEKAQDLDRERNRKVRTVRAINLLNPIQPEPRECITFSVRRDPISETVDGVEEKKAEWNEKYLNALEDGDIEEKNRMMEEAFLRIGRLNIPLPSEVSKKGVIAFYEKDPVTLSELIRFAKGIDQLKESDAFAASYMTNHPALEKKAELAKIILEMYNAESQDTAVTREKKTSYETKHGELKAQEQLEKQAQQNAQPGAPAEQAGEISQEKRDELDFKRRVQELKKKPAATSKDHNRLIRQYENLMQERQTYYDNLIDQKIPDLDANVRKYYMDLAMLVTQLDRRSMGLDNVGEDEETYTDSVIARLLRDIKNNEYRDDAGKAAIDQLFRDTFVEEAERRVDELLREREEAAKRGSKLSMNKAEDAGGFNFFSTKSWYYRISKREDYKSTAIGGIHGAKNVMDRLGIGDLHMSVEDVIVKDEEGKEYPGIRYRKIDNRGTLTQAAFEDKYGALNGPNVQFTPEALKQISSVRLMQYLFGDTLGDEGNILYQTTELENRGEEKILITAVKVDFFPGNFDESGSGMLKKGEGNLPQLKKFDLPILDRELVDNILDMKGAEIREIAGDVLDESELLAFDNRLKYIQEKLREAKEEDAKHESKDKVLFEKDDWWDTEKLAGLEERLKQRNEQMYPDVFEGVKVAGISHGNLMDEDGGDIELFYNKVYRGMREYVDGATTLEEKCQRLKDVFKGCYHTEVFGRKNTTKYHNATNVSTRICGEVISKDLLKEIYKGWLDVREKIIARYNELADELKDQEVPEEYRDVQRFKQAEKDDKNKAKEKEKRHYILFLMQQQDPEQYREYVLYEDMAASLESMSNHTGDVDFDDVQQVTADVWQEVQDENQDALFVKEHGKYGKLFNDYTKLLTDNEMLINKNQQKAELIKFYDYQDEAGREVVRRVVGGNMIWEKPPVS